MKTYTYKGTVGNLEELSRMCGLIPITVRMRLENGWSLEKALETPARSTFKRYTYNGLTGTLGELAKIYRLDYRLVQRRVYKGWTLEEALETPVKAVEGVYAYKGTITTLKELARISGIPYNVIYLRIKHRWGIEEAVDTPIGAVIGSHRTSRRYTYKGFTGTLVELSRLYNIKYKTLLMRLSKGQSLGSALETEVLKQNRG